MIISEMFTYSKFVLFPEKCCYFARIVFNKAFDISLRGTDLSKANDGSENETPFTSKLQTGNQQKSVPVPPSEITKKE
jgi:hypothetical protein